MKRLINLLISVLAVPLASAQQSQGAITDGFSFLFGQSSNEIVLKLGLFILLIGVFKAGFTKLKLFEENPNMNMLLGAVLSLIAIKFMPVEFSSGIGTFIWVAALFVLPYLLVSMFIENTVWRIILTILSVSLIYTFISGGIGPYGSRYPYLGFIRGSEIFDDIYYLTTGMGWLVPLLLIGSLAGLIYLIKKNGMGGGGNSTGGAWSRWRDRAKELKIAKEPRKIEEIAARERGNAVRENRIKSEKEAVQHRKAEEAKAEAEMKRAEEERIKANKLARQERLRMEMLAREERKRLGRK